MNKSKKKFIFIECAERVCQYLFDLQLAGCQSAAVTPVVNKRQSKESCAVAPMSLPDSVLLAVKRSTPV